MVGAEGFEPPTLCSQSVSGIFAACCFVLLTLPTYNELANGERAARIPQLSLVFPLESPRKSPHCFNRKQHSLSKGAPMIDEIAFGKEDVVGISIVCPKCQAETSIMRPLPPDAECAKCGQRLPLLTIPAFGHDPVMLPVVQIVDTLLKSKGILRFRIRRPVPARDPSAGVTKKRGHGRVASRDPVNAPGLPGQGELKPAGGAKRKKAGAGSR